MTVSPIKRYLVPSLVLAGTVFSSLTLPLALFGSEQVVIQVKKEPVFYGQLRDIAAPYLGFAAALSLGAAASSVTMTGWRRSSRKSSQMEEQLSRLQQNLQAAEAQIEQLKVSEVQLENAGLSAFLEEDTAVVESLQLPVAKTAEPVQQVTVSAASDTSVQVKELKTQLQQMQANITMLEGMLQATPKFASDKTPVQTQAESIAPQPQRLQNSNPVPVRVNLA